MNWERGLALFGAMLVLSITPGAIDVAIVARAIASGFRQSLLMVGGIVLADFFFIFLAIYGLSRIADSVELVFPIVKGLGAGYLIVMGIRSLRSRRDLCSSAHPAASDDPPKASHYSSLSSGFLITLGEPKVLFFYLGFLPAFVDLRRITLEETLSIFAIAGLVVGGVKTAYAYLAVRAREFLHDASLRQQLNRLSGFVLILTALFVLFSA